MATKHDLILAHIENLPVGDRISVRGIAKDLNVSEGTAYRAIKDAENIGLVSTIQRVGTIRIERKLKKHIEKLTFGEVVQIIEGDVLGRRSRFRQRLEQICYRRHEGIGNGTLHHSWFLSDRRKP